MNNYFQFLLLIICTLGLSGCERTILREEDISSGEFSAHISEWSQAFGGSGSNTVFKSKTVTLFGHDFYKILDEDFFKKEIDENYNPGDYFLHELFVFPHKKMLVTNFSITGGGGMIAGFVKKNGEAHLVPLVGCYQSGTVAFTRLGRKENWDCDRSYISTLYEGRVYKKLQISEHNTFWVDYKTEEIYEIPYNTFGIHGVYPANSQSFETNKVVGIAGLNNARKHLLMLYKTLDKSVYNLCAYSVVQTALNPAYQCFSFQPKEAPPAFTPSAKRIVAPVPATSKLIFTDGGDAAVSSRFEWVSKYFDFNPKADIKPLSAKTDTKVIALKSGF